MAQAFAPASAAQRMLAESTAAAQNAAIPWSAGRPHQTQTLVNALAKNDMTAVEFQAARALLPIAFYFTLPPLVADAGEWAPASLAPDVDRGFNGWVWVPVQLFGASPDARSYGLIALFYSPVTPRPVTQWTVVLGTQTPTQQWRTTARDVDMALTHSTSDGKETMTLAWEGDNHVTLVRDAASGATAADVDAAQDGMRVTARAKSQRGPTFQFARHSLQPLGPLFTTYWSVVDGVVAPGAATIDGVSAETGGTLWYDSQQLGLQPLPPLLRMLGSLAPYEAPKWLWFSAMLPSTSLSVLVGGNSVAPALRGVAVSATATLWRRDMAHQVFGVPVRVRVEAFFTNFPGVPHQVSLAFGPTTSDAVRDVRRGVTLTSTFPRDASAVAFGIGAMCDVPGVVYLADGSLARDSSAVLEAAYFGEWTPARFAAIAGFGEEYGAPSSIQDPTPAALTLTAAALGVGALAVGAAAAAVATSSK